MTPSEQRQEQYEIRRRSRLLGLSIDQTLTGIKNIITYSNHKFWAVDDEGLMEVQQWKAIQDHAENILLELMKLERKLANMKDIYATFIPMNPEVHTVPQELENKK